MSKKIIYLLSLVMALSLVFASCKKSTTDPNGGIPGEEPSGTPPPTDLSGGLFDSQEKLDQYKDKRIQASEIAKYKDKNYMRNPVITVVNDSTVVIFYEVRYQSPGSANDTALTGTNTVDIAYTVSTDAGVSFDTSVNVKYVGGQATGADNSHGAPVVFYDKSNNKLVVVASAGIGLGVGSYKDGGGDDQSKLQYSVADVSSGTIGEFSTWKDINVNLTEINNSSTSFKQYGTHAAKGVVADDGKLLLPVVLGNFINQNGSWGNSEWGYVLFEGTGSNGEYTFTKKGNTVKMVIDNGTKATRIVSGKSSSDYVYITVSDRGNPVKLYSGVNDSAPTITSIQAHDGAAGTLIVKNWQGENSYNPQSYDVNNGTTSQALLSHVVTQEKEFAIRRVDDKFTTQQGGNFSPDDVFKKNAKSSSMDILKDGTIVVAVEGGQVAEGVADGAQRPFVIQFYRYSQAYLASQTK